MHYPPTHMEVQEFSHNTSRCHQHHFHSDNNNNINNVGSSDNFIVEEFFDFSNDDKNLNLFTDSMTGNNTDSSTLIDTTNSLSVSCHQNFNPDIFSDTSFPGDLCVQYDDLAELEWLSKLEEESLPNEDLQKMQLISGIKASNDDASKNHELQPQPNNPTSPVFNPQVSVPAKARSKRTRVPPCNWTSRLLVLSPTILSPVPHLDDHIILPQKPAPKRRDSSERGEGRKCLHCATGKTPQWRTGPMGPKTLCNACGVRYKSGRLVPEYRPAASPTFMMTRHSNSHRKVMELRRQKEMMEAQDLQFIQHHQNMNMMYDFSSNRDDYLIHQHVGPYFT
ncbi:hypothetical protein TanjilG_28503 [Lupinus angustifolius]|uniref:GATA transcription factor n=1 Tax=Lupinus angustifolius TaxID=3871 RepID=A0A1J7G8H0_LUPAN|nr:PREDICTED: GATA transcription factor 12-like [Lupinus angustifolius]XP_019416565.1 PREDICTED: GATA transcription factor 12-like [Lupinus angustifolius]OIV96646.1 hypothetical protein TanjilG_28503 [Lupinus angustifolius]